MTNNRMRYSKCYTNNNNKSTKLCIAKLDKSLTPLVNVLSSCAEFFSKQTEQREIKEKNAVCVYRVGVRAILQGTLYSYI